MEVFPSHEYKNLDILVRKFLETRQQRVDAACFGVAGPVRNRCAQLPNLGWVVDGSELADRTGIASVEIINDLEANGHGIALLGKNDFTVLNKGTREEEGNAGLIAAGTGLGEGGLRWDGEGYWPLAMEGGHVDFAPRNKLEVDLLFYLLGEFEHVSYERVLSGAGLYNIYRFLRDTGRGKEPAWLTELMNQGDPSQVVSEKALEGRSDLCVEALDVFVSLYGAEAGNLALKTMATGGLYIGGGIAPKIVQKLKDGTFMKAFVAKGRMRSLLEEILVRVILNDKTALLGAARCAARRARNA
jgi:glucokinase